MGQSNTKPPVHQSNVFRPRKYLTKVELVSLQYTFNQLKSTFKDNFECIEAKRFLEHLRLPSEVEPAGVLLFKAFSYLGSYPSCTTAGPVPLSFQAFITAFVVLAGHLDTPENLVSESMFFQALSVLPAPSDDTTVIEEEEEPVIVDKPEPSNSTSTQGSNHLSRGLSLAELGVDFSDMELDTNNTSSSLSSSSAALVDKGPKILCRDLIELFVLLLWLGEADKDVQHDLKTIRETAISIVENIKPTDNTPHNDSDDLPCISHVLFCRWKDMFSPHLFKPLQSLITKSFTYCDDTAASTRILPQDETPTPSTSDILTPLYTTLLSWSLPEDVLVTKQWDRLYSADADGFSMNRFESHVFKYPGPTLFIMRVEATAVQINKPTPASNPSSSIVVGAYITQPWKHSKHFWGTNKCYLFELEPMFDVFRSVQHGSNNDHYIYYHHDFGIGFGATNNQPPTHEGFLLSLQNTLQEGVYQHEAYPSQPSLESSIQSRKHTDFYYKFQTEDIEVFGLGSEKDRERQAKEWKFERQEASRRAGLNIRQTDGQLDKELLKMAGIIDENRQDR